jgi:apolipoprotein N-acyltransferase
MPNEECLEVKKESQMSVKDRRSFLWLAIGASLMVFANGRWIVPAATWLALVFLLRFTRTQKAGRGLAVTLLVLMAVYVIAWKGLIPLPGIFYYIVAGSLGLVFWLAFLADRLLTPHMTGFVGTLVFPLAWTTLEYVYTMTTPYASWGSLAYTQYEYLPLIQVVSVTGIWGVTFLITWFASVSNWIWENQFAWQGIRRGTALYAAVLLAVLLIGGLRLALFAPEANTVRVDSITGTSQTQGLPNKELLENYLERTRLQARAGADIVVLDEAGVVVDQADESLFIGRGCELARQEHIYLLMGLCVMNVKDARGSAFNKAVWINPHGQVVFEYLKHLLIPGGSFIAGDGDLRTDPTSSGNITAAICMDLDHPGLIRQAGRAKADILLAPSSDWKEIDPIHTHMAAFRAVENGFSLVRSTNEGLSAAFDYQGRMLASVDHFSSHAAPLVSYVPTKGVRTVYSVIGDASAWLCAAALAWFIMRVVLRTRKVETEGTTRLI